MTTEKPDMTTEKFEDRLLGELTQVVAERAAGSGSQAAPLAVRRSPFVRRPVLLGGLAAALATGVVVSAPLLQGDRAPAAWAVEESGDGRIEVTITAYEDAQGLEDRLEELGVPAEVDYLPSGQRCKEPRFEPAPKPSDLSKRIFVLGAISSEETHGKLILTFDRTILGPDDTLVIAGAKPSMTNLHPGRPPMTPGPAPRDGRGLGGAVKTDLPTIAIARGPVAPCEAVPAEED
ncbi:hypothetical protein [Actinopolymorpha alba]|uniref:hypothetical protein n=1 Tax=Actinopolymorpha alba TaxID=533267 RepID=UPI00038231F2|nr:hypothetical protein [Actinopolymorpha alba]